MSRSIGGHSSQKSRSGVSTIYSGVQRGVATKLTKQMLELKVQRFREDLQQEDTFEKLRER